MSRIWMLLLPMAGLWAQDAPVCTPPAPPTQLEAYLTKRGDLIVKEIYELGTFNTDASLKAQAVVAYEPGREGFKEKGLILSLRNQRDYVLAYVDSREVKELSRRIAYMQNFFDRPAEGWPDSHAEVSYITQGYVQLDLFQTGPGANDRRMSVSARTGDLLRYVIVTLDPARLQQFKDAIDKGASILASK